MLLLPLASDPYAAPTDRDLLLPSVAIRTDPSHLRVRLSSSQRRPGDVDRLLHPHRQRRLLVSTMAGRGKARIVERDGKVSLCVLDERWPFAYFRSTPTRPSNAAAI